MLYRKFEGDYDYIKLDTVEKLLEYLKDKREASPKASKENLTPSRGGVEFSERIYGMYTYPAKITVSRGKVVISVMWFKPEALCRIMRNTFKNSKQNSDKVPSNIQKACDTEEQNKANLIFKPAITCNIRDLTVGKFNRLEDLGKPLGKRICEVYSKWMVDFIRHGGHDWQSDYPDGEDEDGFDIYDDDIYSQEPVYDLSEIDDYVSEKEREEFDSNAFRSKYRYASIVRYENVRRCRRSICESVKQGERYFWRFW